MRELSLFSGAGGGLLGSLLLGWEPIGYVEFNDYCQRVIAQRIADGILPSAPIFGDIRTFVDSGCAELYRGVAEVVSGGFPCQPFSVAGKRAGADDERNMWPAAIATIRAVRPRFAFLENVPGLVNSGYFGTILGDLAESGYNARWRILSAAELGAPHKRDRLWIVAHAESKQSGGVQFAGVQTDIAPGSVESADPDSQRGQGIGTQTIPGQQGLPWGENLRSLEDIIQRSDIPKPLIRRMDDGHASRVDRLKAIGNAQLASVAATAWHLLTADLID
jgi:DNA (cytosine-5)-methyltransferase 1